MWCRLGIGLNLGLSKLGLLRYILIHFTNIIKNETLTRSQKPQILSSSKASQTHRIAYKNRVTQTTRERNEFH